MIEPEQLDLLDWLAAHPPCPPPAAEPEPEAEPAPRSPAHGPILLTRVDPSCNMRRFYSLSLATSLWGEHGVVRGWGRIGTAGQSRTDWYEEPHGAEIALQELIEAKQRRGYAL